MPEQEEEYKHLPKTNKEMLQDVNEDDFEKNLQQKVALQEDFNN